MKQFTQPRIECTAVADVPGGWSCTVLIQSDDRAESISEHTVRLAWCDHDHWCGGRLAPSVMIESLLRTLVSLRKGTVEHHIPATLPPAFDAARARRWHRDIDHELRVG